MPAADPWLWTTSDILAELRRSTTLLHVTGSAIESTPDSTPLEHYIQEHQLTGSAFLTSFDVQVFNPVQRQALSSAIGSLRRRSLIYQERSTTKRVEALNLNKGSTRRRSNSMEAHSDGETGRKRRKVAHIHTTMPASSRNHPEAFAHSNIEPGVERTDAIEDTPWGYLLKWQEKDGKEEPDREEQDDLEDEQQIELQEAGEESADEEQTGNEEVGDDPADESEEEEAQNEPVQGRSKLSEEQIVDIINEQIAHYSNSWVPNKGLNREDEVDYNVNKMWDDAEAEGRRPEYIAKHEGNIAYYRHRLDVWCDEIRKHPASNAAKLRHQCSNLEVTINNMRLEEWLLSIYELEPVSEGDGEPDSPNSGLAHNRPGLPSNTAPIEVIDLGSPSEISEDGRRDDVRVDEHMEPTLEIQEDHPASAHRSATPDVVIMDTVESPFHIRLEQPATISIATLSKSIANNGDEPENASIGTVRRWRWSDLVATQDRKRVVSKAINEMKPDDREQLRLRLRHVGKAHMLKEIRACLEMLSNGRSKMPGVLQRDLPKIILLTRLFLSWWLCDNYFREDPSKWHLEELRQCLEEDSPDPGTFYDYISTVMTTTFSEEALSHPERPSQIEIIEISDDE